MRKQLQTAREEQVGPHLRCWALTGATVCRRSRSTAPVSSEAASLVPLLRATFCMPLMTGPDSPARTPACISRGSQSWHAYLAAHLLRTLLVSGTQT